ncbi:hypothetical protein [Paenibacillus agricola]|uniref:IDEAL domain-containing protein n=1 Tax=Paenibacillus agricola TaxID=2716264 RepID=A0ABX0J1R8_9BACL|nr:hypothetical protein [Paenibacillus agricola]NHN29766.1 hypothetical protein [Paenibacillus agricola]
MEWAKQAVVQVGDWVSGTSLEDEKIIGYVDSMDLYGIVRVMVTQSDREEAIGYMVNSMRFKLEKLESNVLTSEADLRSLMDLALMTRDQEWFNELGAALRATKSNGHIQLAAGTEGLKPVSRRIKID